MTVPTVSGIRRIVEVMEICGFRVTVQIAVSDVIYNSLNSAAEGFQVFGEYAEWMVPCSLLDRPDAD